MFIKGFRAFWVFFNVLKNLLKGWEQLRSSQIPRPPVWTFPQVWLFFYDGFPYIFFGKLYYKKRKIRMRSFQPQKMLLNYIILLEQYLLISWFGTQPPHVWGVVTIQKRNLKNWLLIYFFFGQFFYLESLTPPMTLPYY